MMKRFFLFVCQVVGFMTFGFGLAIFLAIRYRSYKAFWLYLKNTAECMSEPIVP